MFSPKFLLAVTAIAGLSGMAGRAAAQTCTTDKDCPQSFTCVDLGVGSAEPAPRPNCPPGTDCAKPEPSTTMTPTVIKACQPKACTADANCGPGMVCHTQSYMECSGGSSVAPCAPNTACDPVPTRPAPTTCVTKTTSLCAFKWQVPCNASADCGDGFTCKPVVRGSCPGSSGSGSAGGGSAPSTGATAPAPADFAPRKPDADGGTPPDCTTKESFPGYCAPTATTCAADSDCPASWKCTEYSVGTTPGTATTDPGTPPNSGGGTSTGTPSALPAKPAPDADGGTVTTTRACTSPYGGIGIDVAVGGGPGIPTSSPQPGGGGTSPPTTAGGTRGSAESATSGGGSGCSLNPVGATSGAGGLALFALLGLLVARRRK